MNEAQKEKMQNMADDVEAIVIGAYDKVGTYMESFMGQAVSPLEMFAPVGATVAETAGAYVGQVAAALYLVSKNSQGREEIKESMGRMLSMLFREAFDATYDGVCDAKIEAKN